MSNPLLTTSPYRYDALPFDQIRVEHFLPALEVAIQAAKDGVDRIKATGEASFEGVIVELLRVQEQATLVAQSYHNLRAAHGDDEMQALAKEMMPKLVELESDINLDADLFALIKRVYETREQLSLSTEQKTLLEKVYRSFVRGGANLSDADKQKLRTIDEELSTLGPQFSQNVLQSVNKFQMVIKDEAELAGLPESSIEAARQTAIDRGMRDAWVFTLQMPSVLPFLQYAKSRARREQIWRARGARAFGGEHDNQQLVKRIATLRHQRALLLGYDNHAAFQMEERMAETPERVFGFLNELLDASLPAAKKELEELREFKKEKEGDGDIQPWDYSYWAERLKTERYDFDPELLRPYFELEAVMEGAFVHAERLYGLAFKRTADIPVYHPDVMVYEVSDKASGEFRGLFYADYFPRDTKSGGAWCTRYRGQWRDEEGDHRPHVSIVCNFTKPTPDKPALLTYNEVQTLFHEFGHALHSLLSQCQYNQLACTNVYRDFVELPSQIMENWLGEAEGLQLFAKHYKTGERLPEDLVKKLKRSENFHAGMATVRQLRFGFLDMAWYAADPSEVKDVVAFELQATERAQVLPEVEGSNTSCSFEHIFAGGYSAGYYGYKWAEVLDADAFELFKEKGIFSAEVAKSFCDNILSKGGSEHPMELYKRFRGREPDPKALLRRYELI